MALIANEKHRLEGKLADGNQRLQKLWVQAKNRSNLKSAAPCQAQTSTDLWPKTKKKNSKEDFEKLNSQRLAAPPPDSSPDAEHVATDNASPPPAAEEGKKQRLTLTAIDKEGDGGECEDADVPAAAVSDPLSVCVCHPSFEPALVPFFGQTWMTRFFYLLPGGLSLRP
jgi:hypothetical protein